jgi:hypothetical protein
LLGLDTLPQIAASRIESWGDFLGTFRETLTDGVIRGKFYRPVQNLTIALDYWLWGLAPRGYQASSLAAYAGTIAAIYFCMARITAGFVAPVTAAMFFGLHPVLLNVLPTPCRRSEILVIGFLALALAVLPTARAPSRSPYVRHVLAGLLVLLASGAKDIGVMGIGLVAIHQFILRYGQGFRRSMGRAMRATVPALVSVLVYLTNRTMVLGGLGGYPQAAESRTAPAERFVEFSPEVLVSVLAPFLPPDWLLARGWTLVGVALTIAAGLLAVGVMIWVLIGFVPRLRNGAPAATVIALGVAWLIPPFLLLAFLQENWPWYSTMPTVGFALIVGGLLECSWRLVLTPQSMVRVAGVVVMVPALAAMITALWCTPLRMEYPDWRRATSWLQATWDEVDRKVPPAQAGSVVQLSTTPYYVGEWPTNRPLLGATSTTMIPGVEAYARLKHPAKNPVATINQRPDKRATAVYLNVQFARHPRGRSRPEGPAPWPPAVYVPYRPD